MLCRESMYTTSASPCRVAVPPPAAIPASMRDHRLCFHPHTSSGPPPCFPPSSSMRHQRRVDCDTLDSCIEKWCKQRLQTTMGTIGETHTHTLYICHIWNKRDIHTPLERSFGWYITIYNHDLGTCTSWHLHVVRMHDLESDSIKALTVPLDMHAKAVHKCSTQSHRNQTHGQHCVLQVALWLSL